MTAIDVSDLTLTYPAHSGAGAFTALSGVTFQVQPGQVLAVLGESGSGKSTLLRLLNARTPLTKAERIKIAGGSAAMLGTDLAKARKAKLQELSQKIGYISQHAGAELPGEQKIADILAAPLRKRNSEVNNAELANRVAEMFEILELPLEMLSLFPHELSKGQRQRIALVAQLVAQTKVVIADEPSNGIDATVRPRVTDLLAWYRKQTGAAMLLVSHDISLLEQLADSALILKEGQSVGYGSLNTVFRDATHPYVTELAAALRRTAYDEAATAKQSGS